MRGDADVVVDGTVVAVDGATVVDVAANVDDGPIVVGDDIDRLVHAAPPMTSASDRPSSEQRRCIPWTIAG
jgi:hypothetical protein